MDLVFRGVADIAVGGLEHFAGAEVVQEAVARAIVILSAGAVACALMACAKWDPNGSRTAA